MTVEQRQKLSNISFDAVERNDLETLQQVKTIIEKDIQESEISFGNEFEFFESLLTADLHFALFG